MNPILTNINYSTSTLLLSKQNFNLTIGNTNISSLQMSSHRIIPMNEIDKSLYIFHLLLTETLTPLLVSLTLTTHSFLRYFKIEKPNWANYLATSNWNNEADQALYMFDGRPDTWWHSGSEQEDFGVVVTFKVRTSNDCRILNVF